MRNIQINHFRIDKKITKKQIKKIAARAFDDKFIKKEIKILSKR